MIATAKGILMERHHCYVAPLSRCWWNPPNTRTEAVRRGRLGHQGEHRLHHVGLKPENGLRGTWGRTPEALTITAARRDDDPPPDYPCARALTMATQIPSTAASDRDRAACGRPLRATATFWSGPRPARRPGTTSTNCLGSAPSVRRSSCTSHTCSTGCTRRLTSGPVGTTAPARGAEPSSGESEGAGETT
jgi:hypothetical protein